MSAVKEIHLTSSGQLTRARESTTAFVAHQPLQSDLEWRLTYVGSADSEECDQLLDSVLVGPVPVGVSKFVFEAPAPDPSKIPAKDLLGVTVVLLECLYNSKVFLRVGYYVSVAPAVVDGANGAAGATTLAPVEAAPADAMDF